MKILTTRRYSTEYILKKIRRARSKKQATENIVRPILAQVKSRGDKALRALTKRFDGVALKSFKVSRSEIKAAYKKLPADVIRAMKMAKQNIQMFHQSTITKKEPVTETAKGVAVWREFRPIEKVGLYVPGGTAAYPSTVLMLAIPAMVAGCKKIIMCTPALRDGTCNPAVLVAADMCGITTIFKVGGAQAIAAMAYGTKSIPKVDKIFGPGNQFVTTAKMLVYGEVNIDMPAGPSEICVIADDTANPAWVSADLLSQLEHGADSQALLMTTSSAVAQNVICEMKKQIRSLSRRKIITAALRKSYVIIAQSLDEIVELINEYAPEHLEIISRDEEKILKRINNVGSVFLGAYSSEPLGDYASGTNHTLPTSGFAKMFSPLSAESFGKMIQVQKISKRGIDNLRETVETLAAQEGLDAHKNSITIRFT